MLERTLLTELDKQPRNVLFASFLDRLNRLEAEMYVTAEPSPRWDDHFMKLALVVAEQSKDRSRKVGCVIVGPRREIRATGYNGFPRGVNDNVEERHKRPAKYLWTEHAERNAIYNAASSGQSTLGCIIYLPWYPCMDCARAIVQCGIFEVVAVEPDWQDPQYKADFALVAELFNETGVLVRFVKGEAPKQAAL